MLDMATQDKVHLVGIRMPIGLYDQINQDLARSEDYASISQWIMSACREYLRSPWRLWPAR